MSASSVSRMVEPTRLRKTGTGLVSMLSLGRSRRASLDQWQVKVAPLVLLRHLPLRRHQRLHHPIHLRAAQSQQSRQHHLLLAQRKAISVSVAGLDGRKL